MLPDVDVLNRNPTGVNLSLGGRKILK